MKINVNRLCELAGISSNRNAGLISEASNRSMHDDPGLDGEAEYRYGSNQLAEAGLPIDEEGHDEGMRELDEEGIEEVPHPDADEGVIEVDEAMLVQELRRAKRIMKESRNRQRRQLAEERQLKKIIEEEVANVMSDLNLTSGWVYGEKSPRRSRRGVVHQGSFLKGIGFK